MTSVEKEIAQSLLKIKAVKLSPNEPFTWASGWNSPIYCDNRVTLSYPTIRKQIYQSFAQLINEKYPEAELIAGVATGAIAHGVLVAEEMQKPFIYVRSAPKGHGLGNQIEGQYSKGQKVVVIEDLISTGGSSLSAVEALKEAGVEVLGMVAIFTYGFATAEANFQKANLKVDTLSCYNALIDAALESNYIQDKDLNDLKEWRTAPDKWRK
ncbi:orotate phosphoribosyltransferase [Alistipes sp. ZOR0009]|uniref:orotate phosphoribosyltransferase n=1 Tax=Alistipes sp. ZOR0009 TaxID=1339253 RepID=UPI0006480675|nr:orotate phosphoribosyltransferase [Alistipes sp. ZOR0009]